MANTVNDRKGYPIDCGYRGWIPDFKGRGRWMIFATEGEYNDAYKEAVIGSWKKRAS